MIKKILFCLILFFCLFFNFFFYTFAKQKPPIYELGKKSNLFSQTKLSYHVSCFYTLNELIFFYKNINSFENKNTGFQSFSCNTGYGHNIYLQNKKGTIHVVKRTHNSTKQITKTHNFFPVSWYENKKFLFFRGINGSTICVNKINGHMVNKTWKKKKSYQSPPHVWPHKNVALLFSEGWLEILDVQSGHKIWKKFFPGFGNTYFLNKKKFTHALNLGNIVYVFSTRGELCAIKITTGLVVWKISMLNIQNIVYFSNLIRITELNRTVDICAQTGLPMLCNK